MVIININSESVNSDKSKPLKVLDGLINYNLCISQCIVGRLTANLSMSFRAKRSNLPSTLISFQHLVPCSDETTNNKSWAALPTIYPLNHALFIEQQFAQPRLPAQPPLQPWEIEARRVHYPKDSRVVVLNGLNQHPQLVVEIYS